MDAHSQSAYNDVTGGKAAGGAGALFVSAGHGEMTARGVDDSTVARMVLGAQLDGRAEVFQSLALFGGLLLVLMLAAVILLYLRRQLRKNQPDDAALMSLDDLRRLRDDGTLSAGEYERLRSRTIEAMTGGASSEAGSSAR